MKIYFAGSIRGGRNDKTFYSKIIEHLKLYGEVLTEHVGDSSLTSLGEKSLNDFQIHDRDMKLITSADLIVAEVSNPSLGVGYEIRTALEIGKKVICLFRIKKGQRLSAMISGSRKIINLNYNNIKSLKKDLDVYISKIKHLI